MKTGRRWGDLWSLKPVFLLSWALMEDPYPDDEFVEDDVPDEEQGRPLPALRRGA